MSTRITKLNPTTHCWIGMEKLMNCATKIIKGSGSTPGFCSDNIEVRFEKYHLFLLNSEFLNRPQPAPFDSYNILRDFSLLFLIIFSKSKRFCLIDTVHIFSQRIPDIIESNLKGFFQIFFSYFQIPAPHCLFLLTSQWFTLSLRSHNYHEISPANWFLLSSLIFQSF